MVNFKEWNVKELGNLAVLGIVLVVVISVFMTFINPLLVNVLPTVFTTKLTLTDILLFLMLIKLHTK